jgi:hypothetical protein
VGPWELCCGSLDRDVPQARSPIVGTVAQMRLGKMRAAACSVQFNCKARSESAF